MPVVTAVTGNRPEERLRILLADHEQLVIEAYRNIFLSPPSTAGSELESTLIKLIGGTPAAAPTFDFEVALYGHADDMVRAVRDARQAGRPFAVAFIDARLPPGRGGGWAAGQIRRLDPDINLVMVTTQAEADLGDIADQVPPADRLFYIQKPFYPQEIVQFAAALGARWRAERALARYNRQTIEAQVSDNPTQAKLTSGNSPGSRLSMDLTAVVDSAAEAVVAIPPTNEPTPGECRQPPRLMEAGGKRKRILIVDYDTAIRNAVRNVLEQAEFTVEEAADSIQALAICEQRPPHAILLDASMPEAGSSAVCTALSQRQQSTQVPIVLLTRPDEVDSVQCVQDLGAADFISKPLNNALLLHRVRHCLRVVEMAAELRESEARLVIAQRIAKLGYWRWNAQNDRLQWSREISRMGGLPLEQFSGNSQMVLDLIHPDDREAVDAVIQKALHDGVPASIDHRIVQTDGKTERFVRQEVEISRDAAGHINGVIGTVQDITERRHVQEHIRHLAYYDSVTGLPNRSHLQETLQDRLAQAQHYRHTIAVFFLDLDQFKLVNDTLGHSAGDKLLQQVAERLLGCVRSCDQVARVASNDDSAAALHEGGNTIARLGGDEFVIVADDMRGSEDAALLAQRIVDMLGQPFVLDGNEVYVTTSIGISLYPTDGDTCEQLLKRADAAMYQAKERGRNGYQFYAEPTKGRTIQQLLLRTELRRALDQEQLLLHYQPKLDIHQECVVGAEALVRWQHPSLGMVSPVEFIPLAEETGLIVPLGEWVLRTACAQARAWRKTGLPPLVISVNLSAAQFGRKNLLANILQTLQDTGLEPAYLEMELTESVLMDNSDYSIVLLNELKNIGLNVSIDDFGTGYSSLAYLKRFPINALKIDRSFIRDITSDEDDAVIVTATIALAHSLGIKVIAEGVENEAQMAFLRAHDCDQGQGYLFSPPLSPPAFVEWLNNWQKAS